MCFDQNRYLVICKRLFLILYQSASSSIQEQKKKIFGSLLCNIKKCTIANGRAKFQKSAFHVIVTGKTLSKSKTAKTTHNCVFMAIFNNAKKKCNHFRRCLSFEIYVCSSFRLWSYPFDIQLSCYNLTSLKISGSFPNRRRKSQWINSLFLGWGFSTEPFHFNEHFSYVW